MEPQDNQNWQSNVQKDIDQLNAKYNLDKVNSKFSAKQYKIIPAVTSVLGIVLIIVGFIPRDSFEATMKTKVFFILGTVILIASLIFLGVIQGRVSKARKKILAELNLNSYYSSAIAQATDNKYKLTSLKKQFDVSPRNFIPSAGTNRTDKVMNIDGRETKFSFGTITNEVVHRTTDSKGNTHSERIYTRYRYLNVILVKESELVATIKKSVSFLKVFKSKDNTDLESTEFEKIFAVVANDQILIRKLLVPKVLASLVDKANSEQEIPAIEFNKQNLTICWPSFKVSGWSDPKGAVAEPKIFSKKENLADTLCQKIVDDIDKFLACVSWVDTYEVI